MDILELKDAIYTDLGIVPEQCKTLSQRTVSARIPLINLDRIGKDASVRPLPNSTELEMITVSITALNYNEVRKMQKLRADGDDFSKSFYSTLSNIARINLTEICRGTSAQNQDCYYGKIQNNCESLHQLNGDSRDTITLLQDIFGTNVEVHQDHEHQSVQLSREGYSSSNLKFPYKIIWKGEMFYFVYLLREYTVKDCLLYSPNLYTLDNVKTSFILFQVLKFFSSFENHFQRDISSLCWNDIEIDSNGWVRVQLPESCFLSQADTCHEEHPVSKPQPVKSELLSDMIDGWICGNISNLDYLMFLNKLSGRNTDDPNHHPILPWVSTFQNENSSWRDLTKSKYRLNKGDRQLDIQYSMMCDGIDMKKNSSQNDLHQVPHHVPEYLSDITYYVYTARRHSKSILCKLVRSYWEPNEYPSSIQRMQQWTPDECIPEFYTDPTVFKSIHDDMNDLSVPDWSKDAEDFVHKHREMLESDVVSKSLHHWIDITFGYKLSGKHAENEKNVCLPLVDNHTSMRKHGIAQLFTAPHPEKRMFRENTTTDKFDNPTEMTDRDESMQLPEQFNTNRDLQELENLLKFKTSVWNNQEFSETLSASTKLSWSRVSDHHTAQKNISDKHMATFACLMVELFLPVQTRIISDSTKLEKRFELCKDIFKFYRSNFPTPFQFSMQYFLDHMYGFGESSMSEFDPCNFKGYPSMTLGILSSPYIHILPFPDCFHDLHEVLEMIMLHTEHISKPLPLDHMAMISERLECLFESLEYSDDCLQIFTPFICKLLKQDIGSAVGFLIENFEIISKAMGEKQSNKDLLPLILRLYHHSLEENTVNGVSDEHTQLMYNSYLQSFYDKAFLLQLYNRLGLKSFMQNIPECLSNALVSNSLAIVSETAVGSLLWLIDRIGPTLTSKYIIKHLFRVVSLCFYSADALASNEYRRVKDCLVHAAEIFGPSFVTLQYLPFLTHRISSSVNHPRFALRHQAAVESSLCMVSHLITYLTDTILMQELTRISKALLMPAINLLCCQKFCFPQGLEARKSLCMQVIHLIALVVIRIGREMSKKHLTPLFRAFFSCFHLTDTSSTANSSGFSSSDPSYESIDSDSVRTEHDVTTKYYAVPESSSSRHRKVHKSWFSESPRSSPGHSSPTMKRSSENDDTAAKDEVSATFCAETAYKSYVSFTRLLGGIHMQYVLGSIHDYVHKLCLQHEKTLKGNSMKASRKTVEQIHTDVMMVGNQLVVESPQRQVDADNGLDLDIMSTLLESSGGVFTEDQLGDSVRRTLKVVPASQLTENWLAYWEHEIGLPENDRHIHFNQIELQSFSGHSNAVRCIACHPTEDWFLSGGRDKTVKIWSVPENLDARKSRDHRPAVLNEAFAYKLHKKSVNYVGILESEQVVISNDGNIHVWDPYSCQQILTFDNSDVKSGFALVSTLPSPSRYAITVTNDSDMRIIDLRRKCLAQEYKIVVATSMGIARAMCVLEGGNRIAVGFSTGMVSAIDIRMGNKLSIKPAHENDISAMVAVSQKKYLTASSDQTVSLWDNGQALTTYKSFHEPVHTMKVFNDEIISGSVGNKIYVHALPSQPENVTSTVDKPKVFSKLRNDTFRGVLSAFCILPLKRQLVLASDTGSIKLLA